MARSSYISVSISNPALNAPAVVTAQSSTLTVTLTNTSGAPIMISRAPPTADAAFLINLDLANLFTAAGGDAGLSVSAPGWSAAYFPSTAALPGWILTATSDITWDVNDSLTFTVANLTATVAAGTQQVAVGFPEYGMVDPAYFPIHVRNPAQPLKALSEAVSFTLVNPATPKAPVPSVLITKPGSPTATSQLVLTMSLLDGAAPLVSAAAGSEPPAFQLSFVSTAGAFAGGALTSRSDAAGFAVTVGPAADWASPTMSTGPIWTLQPLKASIMAGGTDVTTTITIGNIVTQMAPGPTFLMLNWANLPGYLDGSMLFAIEKTYPAMSLNSFTILSTAWVPAGQSQPVSQPQSQPCVAAQVAGGYAGSSIVPTATLAWEVENASAVILSGVGLVPAQSPAGGLTVTVERSTVFVLSAYDMARQNVLTSSCAVTTLSPLRPSTLPAGAVAVWQGSAGQLPAGWVLCDGGNGAPDLRDRFILGAMGAETPGQSGAGDSHGHTLSELSPATAFSFTAGLSGAHAHGTPSGWYEMNLSCGKFPSAALNAQFGQPFGGVPDHQHTVSISFPVLPTDGQSAGRPPWYALCYIMFAPAGSGQAA